MERLKKLFREYALREAEQTVLLPLSGSARKYYRMSAADIVVIGVIGTNLAENKAFLTLDRKFREEGLNAPEVFGVSPDGMAYIQQDLGDGQLFELLKESVSEGKFAPRQMEWLRKTVRMLPSVQYKVGRGFDWSICFPDREFNRRMINFDLNYFKYDFLKLTSLDFNEIALQDDLDQLCEDSLEYDGDTFLYRDFQARNVMIKDDEPWFIDFQGGRRGPVQYDLGSFLWNAGTHFSADVRAMLEKEYLDALQQFTAIDAQEFYKKYRLITLVRLLQEFGAYGYRGLVERKQLFIDCIPTALGCIGELISTPFERYPYLNETLRRLSTDWDGETKWPDIRICRSC